MRASHLRQEAGSARVSMESDAIINQMQRKATFSLARPERSSKSCHESKVPVDLLIKHETAGTGEDFLLLEYSTLRKLQETH